jgi:hypothetical protein
MIDSLVCMHIQHVAPALRQTQVYAEIVRSLGLPMPIALRCSFARLFEKWEAGGVDGLHCTWYEYIALPITNYCNLRPRLLSSLFRTAYCASALLPIPLDRFLSKRNASTSEALYSFK